MPNWPPATWTELSLDAAKLSGNGHYGFYVPFGEAWYGYSVRRLKENPSIAGYVARDVLRGFAGRA